MPEAATRESLILAGQVDLIVLPPIADLPALQRNPALKVLLAPSDRTIFISLNTTKPPLGDVRVRQALNYAVDKKAIIQNVLFGAADEMDAPMAPSLFGYCKAGTYEYNPAKAKQLLTEAGVKPGTKISLPPPDRPLRPGQGGLPGRRRLPPRGGHRARAPDHGLAVVHLDHQRRAGREDRPPAGVPRLGAGVPRRVASRCSSSGPGYHPPAGLATSFYKNAKVDELVLAADRESNPDKRKALYCEISKQVWADAPWLFLYVQRFPIVYSSKVTDVGSLPNEKFSAIHARPAN